LRRRPRIGLTLDLSGDGSCYTLLRGYPEAVAAAGGLPVPLTHEPGLGEAPLDGLDGLVVTGGAFDIPPELYGEARRPVCGPLVPERTASELALLGVALRDGLPVLGVCGGMQLLAVALGATLWQDLPADAGLGGHEQPPPRDRPSHPVEVLAGTRLAGLVGAGRLDCNSTHHQAVRAPGPRLAVSARAPDGVVEAVELDGPAFVVGVQWHPEAVVRHEPRHAAIYRGLVAAAVRRSAGGGAP